jgi:hypothetical protein
MFLVLKKSIDFYSEFYVHLLFEFSTVLDYDEMNCNIGFGVLSMYSKVQILVICSNHDSNVGINGSVKFVDNLRQK